MFMKFEATTPPDGEETDLKLTSISSQDLAWDSFDADPLATGGEFSGSTVSLPDQRPSQKTGASGSGTSRPPFYVCENCNKPYRLRSSMRRHQHFECGVAPKFKCDYCPHRARHTTHLRMHVLRKHGVEMPQRKKKKFMRWNKKARQ